MVGFIFLFFLKANWEGFQTANGREVRDSAHPGDRIFVKFWLPVIL